MADEDLRQKLCDAYKHRAILYYLIFDEMRKEVGQEKAKAVMKRAIYRRGVEVGAKFARFAPDDFEGLCNAFAVGSETHRWLFAPEVERCDAEGLDVKHGCCPLKEAWQEIGLSGDEVALMCEIAAVVDNGTFEGAGFAFSADTWRPDGDGCCHLHIRPGRSEG